MICVLAVTDVTRTKRGPSGLAPGSLVGVRSPFRVEMQAEVHIPSGADIQEGLQAVARFLAVHIREAVHIPEAHIREAVRSTVPHPPNTCGHMDRDGNPAGIPRTGSTQARREATR
jgi:hypothetical protein